MLWWVVMSFDPPASAKLRKAELFARLRHVAMHTLADLGEVMTTLPAPKAIGTAPQLGDRPLFLFCPEAAGWQSGEWDSEGQHWRSAICGQTRLDPTHWMPLPPDPVE